MQEMDRKTVTLVLGGVRSGKSRWAQELAIEAARVAYVATAQPCDAEMTEKIRRHRAERPISWCTFEEPLEIGRLIADHAPAFDVMIIDYELPEMTGAQLAQKIRALEPEAQILLLSRRSHLPAGELVYVDFHAVKDLPLDTLIEIVKSLIESSTQSPESAA